VFCLQVNQANQLLAFYSQTVVRHWYFTVCYSRSISHVRLA